MPATRTSWLVGGQGWGRGVTVRDPERPRTLYNSLLYHGPTDSSPSTAESFVLGEPLGALAPLEDARAV